ncbi:MAG: peptidoglycan editing factor PgeF [Armatimonadota bacterium]
MRCSSDTPGHQPEQLWALKLQWPMVAGGVSSRGDFNPEDDRSGLNISYHVGDEQSRVRENRRRILEDMGCEGRICVRAEQVHGNDVFQVTDSSLQHLPGCPSGLYVPETDGLVTDSSRVVLNLAYADCVPVLLYCPDPLTVGVLHAGWRGTASQIGRKGIETMVSMGCRAEDVQAVIGPAICGACYEVGPEVIEAMQEVPGASEVLEAPPHDHVDLKALNRLTLAACGVPDEAIEVSDLCTRCGPVPLFSYRGARGRTGLHGAFIAITR